MLIYVFIIFASGSVIAILWAGVMGLGMIREFERPAERSRGSAPTPLNALLVPALLTERGRQFRRRYFVGLLLSGASSVAAGVVTLWL